MSLSHRGQSFVRKAIGFRRQLELSPPLVVSGNCKFVIRERHAHLGPRLKKPGLSSQKRPFVWSPNIGNIYLGWELYYEERVQNIYG